MTKGTGKARKLVKAMPLAVLDCMATCAAVIAAAWGTRELGEVLNGTGFAFSLMMLSAVNVVVFHASVHRHGPLMESSPCNEQVAIGRNFGDCLLDTINAQLDDGLKLITHESKCAFERKGCGIVSPVASMMVA